MPSAKASAIGLGFVSILVALTAADVLMKEGLPKKEMKEEVVHVPTPSTGTGKAVPTSGVRKRTGLDVDAVLKTLAFDPLVGEEAETILSQIIPANEGTVEYRVLLQDNDRAGMIAWIETPDVKKQFAALKEALFATFSLNLSDLVDEVQYPEDKPTRNFLTFSDPAISPERVVFIRVREQLIEMHIAEGMDEQMFKLLDALSE